MIANRSILASILLGVWLAATSTPAQTPDDGAPPAPLWTERPLRVDVGEGVLSIEPVSGPREVGLPLRFAVRTEGGIPADAILPAPGTVLGDFEVVPCDDASIAPSRDDRDVQCWSIRTFASGDLELPAFEVRVDGATVTVPTRTLRIESVVGRDADLDAYRDIAGAVDIGRPVPLLIWWIVAGGLLLAAVLLFLRLRPRRPRPEPPPIPADVWALAALKDLAARELPARGQIQRFFFDLTDIVRSFMERRYDISAPERTTREFIREAERHPLLSSDQASMLGNLLRSADLVKFAGDRPASAECARALEIVEGFVVSAGPKPAPDAAPDEGPTLQERSADERDRRSEVRSAIAGLDELEAERR